MRFKVLAAGLMASIAFLAVAGCGPDSATPPVGTTSAAPTTPTSEIASPLDVSKFAADICSGLTDVQLAPYMAAIDTKDPQAGANGPICTFNPKDPLGPSTTIGIQNIAAPTQESLYESLTNFPWRQKIAPIASYPSVNSSASDSPSKGDCETAVSVNAKQFLYIQFSDTNSSDSNYTKPCTVSNALMAELIQGIQAGGA